MRRHIGHLAALICAALGSAPAAEASGPIASSQVLAGSLAGPTFSETWTFSGTNGDRVLIGALTTSGSVNTTISLRNPAMVEVVSTAADRVDYQLLSTGTYTIVITDLGLNDAGTYNLSLLNVTAGPLTNASDLNGGPIVSAEVKTGQMNLIGDFDAFTFTGTAGQRVLFGALATSGTLNTIIYVYPPGGAASETNSGGADRLDWQLAATGTYTVVIQDASLAATGNYSISLLNVSAGPFISGSDPDGGAIASGDVKNAQTQTAPDFDGWQFTAAAGDTAKITAVTTAGPINTTIYVYPPGGVAPVVATAADNVNYVLAVAGTHTLVIEDLSIDQLGSYQLTLNIGAVGSTPAPEIVHIPTTLAFGAPRPNPARDTATFQLDIPVESAGWARAEIFDITGRRVKLLARHVEPGRHDVTWNLRDEGGSRVGSGTYFARITAGGESVVRRVVVVK